MLLLPGSFSRPPYGASYLPDDIPELPDEVPRFLEEVVKFLNTVSAFPAKVTRLILINGALPVNSQAMCDVVKEFGYFRLITLEGKHQFD